PCFKDNSRNACVLPVTPHAWAVHLCAIGMRDAASATRGEVRELPDARPARVAPGQLDRKIPAHICGRTLAQARWNRGLGRDLAGAGAAFALVLHRHETANHG